MFPLYLMAETKYIPGSHKIVCDMCGQVIRIEDARYNWKRQLVHKDRCWEPRHPQDFVQALPDSAIVEDARPVVADEPSISENVDPDTLDYDGET